jgi:cytochrome c biogenesis protein CcdA
MIYAGILVTLLGFAIAVLSLGMASSVNARLLIVLVGIAVSLFGIMGVINKGFLKNAIWRKQS